MDRSSLHLSALTTAPRPKSASLVRDRSPALNATARAGDTSSKSKQGRSVSATRQRPSAGVSQTSSQGSIATPAGEFQKIYVKQCAAKNLKPDQIIIGGLKNSTVDVDLDRLRLEQLEPFGNTFRLISSMQNIRIAVNQIKKPADQQTKRDPPILAEPKAISSLVKYVQHICFVFSIVSSVFGPSFSSFC